MLSKEDKVTKVFATNCLICALSQIYEIEELIGNKLKWKLINKYEELVKKR